MDFPPQNTIRFQPGRGHVPPGDRTSTALQKEEAVSVISSPAAKTKSYGPYVYPIHNADRFQGKISFLPIEVNVPKFAITGENWSDFRLFAGDMSDDLKQSENTPDITASGDVGIGGPNSAGQQRRFQPGRGPAQQPAAQESSNSTKSIVTYTPMPEEKIILNMPISYVVNDMIGYDNAELGIGGAAALNGLERTGEMGAALGAALNAATTSVTDLFKQGMGANAARVAFARGVAVAPLSAGLKAAGSIAARVVVNPNVRATFRGVALREFSFQFKFIPYSAEESRMIADIIRTFRIHAYPEAIYAGPVAIGYRYPDLFKIRVQYKGKDVGSKIKMCYLRNVQTSYNPSAASFHADGSPTEIDLSLVFTEHTTISRADVSSDAKSQFGGPPGGETSIVSFDQGDGY